MIHFLGQRWRGLSGIVLGLLLWSGCVAPAPLPATAHLPEEGWATLTPIVLNGRKLRVVATTNLVGDVAARVGGDRIELVTLLAPGTDPHAYQLAPADRQHLEDADLILTNGLGLEEGMLPVLGELESRVAIVAVSAGIATLEFGGHEVEDKDEEGETHEDETHEDEAHEDETHEDEEEHRHGGVDPHTWQSVPNVIVWTDNIAATLSALDPAQADGYAAAAVDYRVQLELLNSELHMLVDTLPHDWRKLVTDHDSLGYLAHEYGFTIVGTVIPSLSTVASTSAQELAALEAQIRAEGVKAIFVGTTVNPQVAGQLADDLGVQTVPIYTDSLSDVSGPAANYVDFMRYNVQTIVEALR